MTDILLLIIGLALIIGGANFLTDGASSLAGKFGIKPLIIGLTIVAFGTSAPELAVSISSSIKGNADIAMGNIVGSNILNILLIGGMTALIKPLKISMSTLKYEIPFALFISAILIFLCLDSTIWNATTNSLSRIDGIILLVLFALFLRYTFWISKKREEKGINMNDDVPIKQRNTFLCITFIIGGLAALVYGGQLFVESASQIARHYHISEAVIAITIVALGTSLPELATSIVAAIKGQHEIAVGNIIGSNIFNITLILGASATINPLYIKGIGMIDYITMFTSVLLLYVFGLFWGDRKLKRIEGIGLLILFIIYIAYLLIKA